MARKVEEASDSRPVRINCPACESVISSDGRELYEKSAKLTRLQETSDGVSEISSALEVAETSIAQLKEENKTLKEKGKVHVMEPRKENRDFELEE
jgi:hypothetical protein